MQEIQSTQAKTRFAELLRSVEHGEAFAITRHGRVVAHLIPARERERSERDAAVERFLERRASWQASGMGRDEILEARHLGHRL